MLAAQAARRPDDELVRFEDGVPLRIGELADSAQVLARRLAPLAGPGARVATCVEPGRAAVELIFALSLLGAVEVPLALDATEGTLRAVLRAARPQLLILGTAALRANPALGRVRSAAGRVLLADDGPWAGGEECAAAGAVGLDELPSGRLAGRSLPGPGDPLAVLATSGTTGRPKAALLPQFAAVRHARRVRSTLEYGPGDVAYNVFPWHHINVRHAGLLAALCSGARLVAHRRFSASRFWEVCREERVTAFNFMGAMLAILDRRPLGPSDRAHRVRLAYGAPAPVELAERFRERFGVCALEAYACTELGDVAANTRGAWRPGTAGRVLPEYEVAVLDELGRRLLPGETGQIAARPRLPHLAFSGYEGDPEATDRVWSRGWFRTGDRGRLDADGYLTFAGRRADVVRRRGESVAAWEVEQVIRGLPGVVDAAVVGVDSELTEQELLAVVSPAPGCRLDGPAVHSWCAGRLERHAVPRYVRIAEELPRNPSGKVVKSVLQERGLVGTDWDAAERPQSRVPHSRMERR